MRMLAGPIVVYLTLELVDWAHWSYIQLQSMSNRPIAVYNSTVGDVGWAHFQLQGTGLQYSTIEDVH